MKTIKEKVVDRVEWLDEHFPKGDKRRGEAIALMALTYNAAIDEVLKLIDKIYKKKEKIYDEGYFMDIAITLDELKGALKSK